MSTDYWRRAYSKWGWRARWITGNGPYALLSWCRVLTVTLHETREKAEQAKEDLDKTKCGHTCWRLHEVVDAREKRIKYSIPVSVRRMCCDY
jgi:hypothetical protein